MAEQGVPSEEQLAEALSRVRVADVLANALTAAVSLGFHRLSPEARDLPEARLAIEALRAAVPVLRDGGVDESLLRDLEQARANLQLAYAKVVEESARPASAEQRERAEAGDETAPDDAAAGGEGTESGDADSEPAS